MAVCTLSNKSTLQNSSRVEGQQAYHVGHDIAEDFFSIDYLLIKRNGVILNKIVSFLHLNFGHILADKCRGVFFFANQQYIAFFGNDVAIQPVDDR